MKYNKIHYLPKYINQNGDLIVYTKDLAELMEMPEREIAVLEARIFYNLHLKSDKYIQLSETILFESAMVIAEYIS